MKGAVPMIAVTEWRPSGHRIERLTGFAGKLGFDTFVLWPEEDPLEQPKRLATDVVPVLRD